MKITQVQKSVSLLFLFTLLFSSLLSLAPSSQVNADGMILPTPGYDAYETNQKAFIIYDGKTEHLVLAVNVSGNADKFGWIVPVPNKPEVEATDAKIFDKLQKTTQPQKNLIEEIKFPDRFDRYYSSDYSAGLGEAKSSSSSVEVIEMKTIGVLDIAVLKTDDYNDLEKWINENGYQLPRIDLNIDTYTSPDDLINISDPADIQLHEESVTESTSTVTPDTTETTGSEQGIVHDSDSILDMAEATIRQYIDAGWYFVVMKVNDAALSTSPNYEYQMPAYDYDYYDYSRDNYDTFINPVKITFESTDMVYPLKISSRTDYAMGITLYTLTKGKYYVSNFDSPGCNESDLYSYDSIENFGQEQYYSEYNKYENKCSSFVLKFGTNLSKSEINDLTKNTGKDSWYEADESMYLAKHESDYMYPEDMVDDVIFSKQKGISANGINDGSMSFLNWISLPFVFTIYAPRNILFELVDSAEYSEGPAAFLFIALILALCIVSALISFGFKALIRRSKKKILKALLHIIQFPFVWIFSATLADTIAIIISVLMLLCGVSSDAALIDGIIGASKLSILFAVIFYRHQWVGSILFRKEIKKDGTQLKAKTIKNQDLKKTVKSKK
ncbi:DUF2330 domain-containing protein [Candidatus Dojkabacteria bacterium]|nr:DUF2330 domain-containing protein [Candidatus Dojkabacteria bacterium]